MKGIMFIDDLRPLVMAGTKTQTRRVVKTKPPVESVQTYDNGGPHPTKGDWWANPVGWIKPRYRPGEVVYVKEPYQAVVGMPHLDDGFRLMYRDGSLRDHPNAEHEYWREAAVENRFPKRQATEYHWYSPLFMPAWAARTFLRILDVRAERVQDISEEDAQAEGAKRPVLYDPSDELGVRVHPYTGTYRQGFEALWDSIAKPGFRWAYNPFCWAYTFERTEAPNAD